MAEEGGWRCFYHPKGSKQVRRGNNERKRGLRDVPGGGEMRSTPCELRAEVNNEKVCGKMLQRNGDFSGHSRSHVLVIERFHPFSSTASQCSNNVLSTYIIA